MPVPSSHNDAGTFFLGSPKKIIIHKITDQYRAFKGIEYGSWNLKTGRMIKEQLKAAY
jgi:hypothetical protein